MTAPDNPPSDMVERVIDYLLPHAADPVAAELIDELHDFSAAITAISTDGWRPIESGWLVEENAAGVIHWIALADDAWPRTKENKFSRRFGFEDYLTPVRRVKDANGALRFARKQDAEAFIKLFDRFLLGAIATEHAWDGHPSANGIEEGVGE